MPHPEAYLASATCVATFNIDKQIRYRVADIENAFRSTVVSQAVGTNVADNAPPNIPRFTLQSGQKVISVSQVQCQMDMNFAEQRKTFDQVGAVVRKNFAGFWAGVYRRARCPRMAGAPVRGIARAGASGGHCIACVWRLLARGAVRGAFAQSAHRAAAGLPGRP